MNRSFSLFDNARRSVSLLVRFWVISLVWVAPYSLADQDTELRLNQDFERSADQREREFLRKRGEVELPRLIIDGKEYRVHRNRDELGRALYVAVSRRNWAAALQFLAAYEQLENPDPLLLHYARGGLSRARGNLDNAEKEFRDLLSLKPDFLLGRLELARVLFENHKNNEALEGFRAIKVSLDADRRMTLGVRDTVDTFLQALERRRGWQGRVAVGPTYNDNINLSSESDTCLVAFSNGVCYIRRTLPDATGALGLDYEATLEKEIFLPGHHGLFARGLAYGKVYRDHSIYNQGTANLAVGYRYRDADNLYTFAPLFEFVTQSNDALYGAWGGRAEWMHYFSHLNAFELEADYKYLQHRRWRLAESLDGGLISLRSTVWHQLPHQWTLFGGLDWVERHSEDQASAYRQPGARIGLLKPFNFGVEMTLFASFREKRYETYSALLGARREDREQHYMAILRIPRLSVAGLVPSLNLEHTRVRSNVDWLYSYEENAASLKFEWRF
tara:strand:+ start:1070 stop:2578 length:1509 start_codon:yes stop_codon:yes gene_type:complete